MHAVVNALRKTWLATLLFVVVSGSVWWKWLDWEEARRHALPTLLLAPVIWWAAIGRRRPPALLRGLAAGALTGLVTQLAPHAPFIWPLLGGAGKGNGEDQMIGMVSLDFYLTIGAGALIMGAIVGVVVTVIERRAEAVRMTSPSPSI